MFLIPYSLGDAIDWKQLDVYHLNNEGFKTSLFPLLARGRDRLETPGERVSTGAVFLVPYSLGDAIDWKRNVKIVMQ